MTSLKQIEANLARDNSMLTQAEANLARDRAQEKFARAQAGRYEDPSRARPYLPDLRGLTTSSCGPAP